jgi:hypothetical protein
MAVSYDLNAIADAMADTFQGLDTGDELSGQAVTVTAEPDTLGVVNVPAVVIELDDLTYDASFGRGADTFVFLVHLAVSSADSATGQRLVRSLLSSGGLVSRLKDALEDNEDLGGLVSYAHMSGTRTIGTINIGGVSYDGATLEVQVLTS